MFAYGATAKLRCLSGDRKLAFETGGNIVRPMPRYPCAIWSVSGYKPLDRWLYVKAASHGPTAYQVPCQFGPGLFPRKADVQSPDLVEIRCFEKGGFQSMEEQVWHRKAGRLCWSCISGNTCCIFCLITIEYKEFANAKKFWKFWLTSWFFGWIFWVYYCCDESNFPPLQFHHWEFWSGLSFLASWLHRHHLVVKQNWTKY